MVFHAFFLRIFAHFVSTAFRTPKDTFGDSKCSWQLLFWGGQYRTSDLALLRNAMLE